MKKQTKTKTAKLKPAMPPPGKRPYKLIGPIKVELMYDGRRYSSGSLGMSFCRVPVKEEEREIGWIDLCIGGGIVIQDERTNTTYGINPIEIWNAYHDAKEHEQ